MIKNINETNITNNIKRSLIDKLTEELVFLRTKLGLSQDELSNILGISRQTYSTFETKKRKMSWGTYLSLILIFDNSEQTHSFIRDTGIFPYILFENKAVDGRHIQESGISDLLMSDIKDKLDEQAIHAIETVIMLEYARCVNMSGDAVIKSFDGRRFVDKTERDKKIANAISLIKENKKNEH